MSRIYQITLSAIAAVAVIGLANTARADVLLDHLRNDPSVINRSQTNNPNMRLLRDPEYTGSLRVEGAEHPLTTICSYESFYWNTIYACNPEFNPDDPVYIEKQRDQHGDQNIPTTN